MNPTSPIALPWKLWLGIITRYSPLWMGCAVAAGALAAGYALVRSPVWRASQPLLIRDEAGASLERLGRFASQTELKAAQETVVEMARNEDVVTAALKQIGPPASDKHPDQWPTKKVVEAVSKGLVSIVPPKGAEFGSTEVLYLETQADTPERARQFCNAILESMRGRLRILRRVRADSIVSELTEARDQGKRHLADVTERIRALESEIGADLAELRNMTETGGGDGAVRRSLIDTLSETQLAELELDRLTRLRNMLEHGRQNPEQLVLAGEDLLNLQPTLKRLKDGLIDAQLQRSQLSGSYKEEHPRMRGAELAEAEIRDRLAQEIEAAINGMSPRLAIAQERVSKLAAKQLDLKARLDRLAEVRSDYMNLSVQLRQRSEALAQAERALSEAEALRSSADSTNFVEALGPPQVADDPIGPSSKILAVGATTGGMLFGFGLVFLIAPMPSGSSFGRRWSDYARGRRSSDHSAPSAPTAISPEAAAFAASGAPGRRAADRGTADREAKPEIDRVVAPIDQSPRTTAVENQTVDAERRRRPRQPPSNLFGS